jgi:hypothetical protein
MRFPKRTAAALAVAQALWAAPTAALAVTDNDLNELREQIKQLREQYEQRIDALEKRLQDAEHSVAQANAEAAKAGDAAAKAGTAAGTAQTSADQAAAQASAKPAGEGAFNPAVSLILNGTYGNLSRDPNQYRINGFVPTQGEVAPPPRSFSLGESELALAANIDQYFRGSLNAALQPDNSLEVEEANVQTLSLSNGFAIKAGRFFSASGYLNEVHAHAWDFTDAPLANKVFLGGQMADDGVQVKWVAPTELYLDLGFELGRGRTFPGGPEGGRSKNGIGSSNLFAHLGGDIGDSTGWKIGLSNLRTNAQDRTYTDFDSTGTTVTNSFTGSSDLWIASGILKWAPNGNATSTNFKLQGEYFRRSENGSLAYDTTGASLGTRSGGYSSRQSGWYLQGVYQFMPEWRVGYRYDRLDSGSTSIGLVDSGALSPADFPLLAGYNPTRNTIMVDWSGSEFSRLRLQLAQDKARLGAIDNQVFLQYIFSLGAHGAHLF